jgi:MFS family permease
VQGPRSVASAYLLTYGGFLLLGSHGADLLGRRRLLVAGTSLSGISSLVCGLAGSERVLIGARLAQGVGAAMMTPAALFDPADLPRAIRIPDHRGSSSMTTPRTQDTVLLATALPSHLLFIIVICAGVLTLLGYGGTALLAVWSAKPARRKAAAEVPPGS